MAGLSPELDKSYSTFLLLLHCLSLTPHYREAAEVAVDSEVTENGDVMGLMLFDPGWVNSSFMQNALRL